MKKALALVFAAVLASACTRDAPAQELVITNARILDGTGRVIERGTVVLRDGWIVSVSDSGAPDGGADALDLDGRTLMPGFIDSHRHLISGDPSEWLEQQAADRMREFLDAGFTTVLSAGDDLDTIIELRRRLAAGEITGPRLIVSGRAALAQPTGGFTPGVDPARLDRSRGPDRPTETAAAIPAEQTRQTVEALAAAGVDRIKTNIIVTPGGPEKDTLALVAEEGRRYGIPTITHAVTVEDTIAAVEAGVDVLVHTPHIGLLDEDQARMIAAAGIPMMSTLSVFVPAFDDDNQPLFRDGGPFPMNTLSSAGLGPVNARLLWEAGIRYGFGTDTRWLPRDALQIELRALHLVFSPRDIVEILTRNAAVTVGLNDEIGTIEPGKAADLVVVSGDPLADVHDLLDVTMVLKAGYVVVDRR